MKISIVVNSKRSDIVSDRSAVAKLAAQYDLSCDIYVEDHNKIESLLKKIIKNSCDAILIIGGDGTVRIAVQVLIHKNIPVAILPQGTFNYFATELNEPTDLKSIFSMIKNKKIKHVDAKSNKSNCFK